MDVDKLICNNKESVKAMPTLMQHCERLDVRNALFIWVDLGTEGWRALGKTLSCTHGNPKKSVAYLASYKRDMASARTKDLRAIWESACDGWEVWLEEWRSEIVSDWIEFKYFLGRR